MLMELGIFKMLEHALGLYSIVAVAWVSALVADLVVNKPLGLSPAGIEFKRAHLYDINPVGVGAMLAATVAGIATFGGVFGATLQSLSAFVALLVAFVMAPVIAWATGGRYYTARTPRHTWNGQDGDPLLDLRAPFRGRRYGALPGLFRADLLAVLLAGDALPRFLQTARTNFEPAPGFVRPGAAGADRHDCSIPTSVAISGCCCSSSA